MSADREELVGYLHGGKPGAPPRRFSLVAIGWAWKRVGDSSVLHLVPPQPLRLSRTACYRLSVYEVPLETPEGLQRAAAYGTSSPTRAGQ